MFIRLDLIELLAITTFGERVISVQRRPNAAGVHFALCIELRAQLGEYKTMVVWLACTFAATML